MEGQQTEAGASALVATVAPTGRRRLRHKLTKEEKRWKLKIGTAAQSMVLLGVVGFSGRAMWSAPSTPWSPAESAHAYPQTDRRLDETASSDTPSAMPTAVPSGTAMPSVYHDPQCDSVCPRPSTPNEVTQQHFFFSSGSFICCHVLNTMSLAVFPSVCLPFPGLPGSLKNVPTDRAGLHERPGVLTHIVIHARSSPLPISIPFCLAPAPAAPRDITSTPSAPRPIAWHRHEHRWAHVTDRRNHLHFRRHRYRLR